MKLKTELLLASALTILIFFGVSEVLSYRQAAEFFAQHEMRIRQEGANPALLAAFRQEKQSLLWELAALRIVSVVGAVAALLAALNWLWGRLVSRPVKLLLDRINSMSRGTWTHPIPVERQDEIGRLLREFNLLGPRLTFAAHQFAAASKLAAMALIGQRVARRTTVARARLAKVQELLAEAPYRGQPGPQAAVEEIGKVAGELTNLAADLESDFNEELVRQGLPSRSIQGENGGASRACSRHDERLAS